MKVVLRFITHKLFIQSVGIAALCLILWFAGPLIQFAGKAPLIPPLHRLIAILIVILLWAVFNLFAQARAMRKDQELVAELSEPQVSAEQMELEAARNEEIEGLHHKFNEALQTLKKRRSAGKRNRQYLYELPWFVIIGGPGVGKTTLLFNSGLSFVTSDDGSNRPVKGIGGTRDCDWFFSDDAIFLDTAGRYTSQDSHRPVDEAAWRGFLDLLKKHRPRRPINGVLIAMSLSDMMKDDDVELQRIARGLRQRTLELYDTLGNIFPIYMIFTKCDLVAGFNEFFGNLNTEDRAQVWGETFPASDPQEPQDVLSRFEPGFGELLLRLKTRTLGRIQDERNIDHRSLILNFPSQLGALKPRIMAFLQEAFNVNRYERSPLLRGVYFTSGTQEGTPIDRLMGQLAGAFGMDRRGLSGFSGRGKSFFINRLLKDVVLPEGEMAGVDPRVERRLRWFHWSVYAALIVVSFGMVSLWWTSYAQNKSALTRLETRIADYQAGSAEAQYPPGSDIEALARRLDLLHAMHRDHLDPPWSMRLGLYQGDKLRAGVGEVYSHRLRMELLPEILDRANRYIRSYARGPKNLSDLNILHEWLKLYLMLGHPERLNEAFASQWIAMCWDREFQNDPDLRIRLKSHSDSLLKELLKHPNQAAALDSTSISLARQQLRNIPLGQQVYTHLKSEALADPSYDFRLKDVLPPLGHEVFTTKQGAQPISELTIPGFFTKNGYSAFFEKQGLNLVHRALKEDWVLGRYSGTPDETARLYNDLQKLYFAEYERKWQDLIGSLAIVKPRGIAETIQILDSISGPDTPLRPLLEAVAENTSLTRKTEEQVTEDSSGEKSDAISDPAAKAMEAWTEETSPQMVSYLESRFRPLNKLVLPQGEAPAPLDRVLERLNLIRDTLLQMTTAASTDRQALTIAGERMSGQGAMNSIEAVKMEFERLPEPVKSWLLSLTASGWEVTLGSAKTELNKIWKTGVLQNYQKSLDQRYPLFIDSRHDANMQDFTRFFAPGGLIDRFFDENLKPFVDTTRPTWQVLSINRKSINLPKMVLKQFQLAAEIRDAFFATGGPSPSIEFELKPIRMDANVDTFWLNIEGQKIHYRHGPALSSRFSWPGPRPSDGVRITFRALDGRETTQQEDGSWALFRAFEKANLTGIGVRDRFQLTFQVGGHHALYELGASSVNNPFGLTSLHQFRCPETL